MNPELKSRWIAALRNGGFVQGSGSLNKDGKHDALGVLCKVIGKEPDDSGFLPTEIAIETRLDQNQQLIIIQMNDNGGSFEKIANYIERNIKI